MQHSCSVVVLNAPRLNRRWCHTPILFCSGWAPKTSVMSLWFQLCCCSLSLFLIVGGVYFKSLQTYLLLRWARSLFSKPRLEEDTCWCVTFLFVSSRLLSLCTVEEPRVPTRDVDHVLLTPPSSSTPSCRGQTTPLVFSSCSSFQQEVGKTETWAAARSRGWTCATETGFFPSLPFFLCCVCSGAFVRLLHVSLLFLFFKPVKQQGSDRLHISEIIVPQCWTNRNGQKWSINVGKKEHF